MLDRDFNTADYCANDNCEILNSVCKLVDQMVRDIQHLEADCIRIRYQLSEYLDFPQNEFYRSDILSSLHSPYPYNLAY